MSLTLNTVASPLSPFSPLGMPKVNLNFLLVFSPLALTLTCAALPAGNVVTVADGVSKPAAGPGIVESAPFSPLGMPKVNLNFFALSVPEASIEAVAL